MAFTPTYHPVLPIPTLEDVQKLASIRKIKAADAFIMLHNERERVIKAEVKDPLRQGWEPPIWTVCDALLGLPWVEPVMAEKIRMRLGFDRPVRILLINGGNRGGKSEYASKRQMKLLSTYDRKRGWALHSKESMSIDYQHPLLWKYFPPEWQKNMRSSTEYVSYKQQTGFADGKFTLPNGSDLRFFYYTMDKGSIEGGNLDFIWPDELVPPDWVETMELRIAEKGGWMVITFTPVFGYTQTVAMFQDGATPCFKSVAYLCPKDKGPIDVGRALGVTNDELAELELALRENRKPTCITARPEDVVNKILDENYDVKKTMPEGREFELVPRVLKPAPVNDPKGMRAVVFFHSSDNPYANPINVVGTVLGKSKDFIKERFYGLGQRLMSTRFPKFEGRVGLVHVVSREKAAALAAQGTRYHVADPANARNFAMLWGSYRKDKPHHVVYREWPGNYPIPGVGIPGPWAIAGDEKHLDGKRGPAQKSFGFGYWRYKRELARLERWKAYGDGFEAMKGEEGAEGKSEEDWIVGLDEYGEAEEKIFERIVDSRFASNPKTENDRPSTLLTDFADIGVTFKTAPGKSITDAIQCITDALDYDDDKPVDYFNTPDLVISEDCVNLIFALSTWANADGSTSATKDFIDVLWMWLQSELVFVEDGSTWNVRGGGSY